jgi:hypothetical protein
MPALAFAAATGLTVEDRMRALEEQMQKDHDEIAALKAQLSATPALPAGALLTFADGRTKCPAGFIEPEHLKGRVMTATPINGTSGAVFNRPFDAWEIGRTPAHSHAVSVNDPGHTHVGVVNDPGHSHSMHGVNRAGHGFDSAGPANSGDPMPDFNTNRSKTGIVVDNLPAKSSIEVSIDANDAGEHYPLVYVLLCQKLP